MKYKRPDVALRCYYLPTDGHVHRRGDASDHGHQSHGQPMSGPCDREWYQVKDEYEDHDHSLP